MYTALLTAVVTWISANFELPPDYNHPSIKLVPAVEITFLRYKAFTLAQQRELLSLQIEGTAHSTRREAVAVYDDLYQRSQILTHHVLPHAGIHASKCESNQRCA
jgi:hypothetical protein